LGNNEWDDKRPSARAECDADPSVHEQSEHHRREDGDLSLPACDVEVRRFEGGEEPHGEDGAEEHEGFGGAAPGEVVHQVLGELRDGEDEDEVIEELER
jgi:hypothetical protein